MNFLIHYIYSSLKLILTLTQLRVNQVNKYTSKMLDFLVVFSIIGIIENLSPGIEKVCEAFYILYYL